MLAGEGLPNLCLYLGGVHRLSGLLGDNGTIRETMEGQWYDERYNYDVELCFRLFRLSYYINHCCGTIAGHLCVNTGNIGDSVVQWRNNGGTMVLWTDLTHQSCVFSLQSFASLFYCFGQVH